MSELEQKITDLKAQKESMEAQDEIDRDAYNKVLNDLSAAEYELEQQQAKEQRDQKQQEVIESAVDVLPDMFEALFPAEIFEEIIGLTEYGDKRKQFCVLSQAYTGDHVRKATEPYEEDLALKDEKIRIMNKQSLEVQQQTDYIKEQLQTEKDGHDKAQSELANVRAQLNTVQSNSAVKDEKIAELQSKLEAVQQPKSEPSVDFESLIKQIKSTNTMSADDLVARFNARQKAENQLPLPEVPQAGATFPDPQPQDDTIRDGNTDASPAPIDQPVTQFPEPPEVPSGVPVDQGTQGPDGEGASKTVEERLAELEATQRVTKAQIDRLEKQANLPALEVA